MSIQELIDDFSYLDDWEDRYKYVIELGKKLAPLSPDEHNDTTKVQGCVSQVWLVCDQTDNKSCLVFRGDSDALIVRGLIAILLIIYSGKTADEIMAIDARNLFEQLGLNEHLSPQRSNGLHAMVTRVREHAAHSLVAAKPD